MPDPVAVTTSVDTELDLGADALRALPSTTVTTLLECYGNPLDPDVPVRRAANVTWRDVGVAELLRAAGVACTEYRKDVPLDVALDRGIVAYEVDGVPPTGTAGPSRSPGRATPRTGS